VTDYEQGRELAVVPGTAEMTARFRRSVSQIGRLARNRLSAFGDRAVVWRVDRQLRFSASDRFGHELPQRKEFFRRVWHYVAFNGIEGDYAEFGCHGAFTFRMAWHATRLVGVSAHLWGFDSFAGLPKGADERDDHPQWVPGTMATPLDEFHRVCRRSGMTAADYDVVVGYYNETLEPGAIGNRPGAVAVAYVDCDLYSSTIDVLRFLDSHVRPGSIIGFDDYFCDSVQGPSGERRAAAEHFAPEGGSPWRLVPYVQFGWAGMSFVVEARHDPAGAD
jgi:O-methyltransferase